MQQRFYRLFLPFERRFANAGQFVIGAQANKEIVAQTGIGQERFEADELHASFS